MTRESATDGVDPEGISTAPGQRHIHRCRFATKEHYRPADRAFIVGQPE